MTTQNTESQETTPATAGPEKPGTMKKASPRAARPHVAPSKGNARKKASLAMKGTKTPKKATKAKAADARPGSKTEKVLDLLKRSGGATLKDIMKATLWQAHSVRGFLSGTIGKKMGLTIKSTKGEDGKRSYSIKR